MSADLCSYQNESVGQLEFGAERLGISVNHRDMLPSLEAHDTTRPSIIIIAERHATVPTP
jgi:hypothetical protein